MFLRRSRLSGRFLTRRRLTAVMLRHGQEADGRGCRLSSEADAAGARGKRKKDAWREKRPPIDHGKKADASYHVWVREIVIQRASDDAFFVLGSDSFRIALPF